MQYKPQFYLQLLAHLRIASNENVIALYIAKRVVKPLTLNIKVAHGKLKNLLRWHERSQEITKRKK